jgi:preprotein translocase subunit SecF
MHFKENLSKIYDRNYKLLLVIPLILLIISLGYLFYFYSVNNDIIRKDISLTGGTSITLFSEEKIDIEALSGYLSENIGSFSVRELSDFRTGEQRAVVVESTSNATLLKSTIEEFLKFELTDENSSTESTGSSLGESFYQQLRLAIIVSFILMAIVIFVIFRTVIPSLAVVISAFADIVMTLTLVNLLGIRVSSAGIVALLMLIGYSVDSDIMLTTRLLKRRESTNRKLFSAFKTGMTMTLTSILAIFVALFITQSFSEVLKQIFTILLIGLGFDILNTWITNASILKFYLEVKNK